MAKASIEYFLSVSSEGGEREIERVENAFDRIGAKTFGKTSQGLDSLFGRMISLNQAAELAEKAFRLLSLPIEAIIATGSKFEDIQLQLETVLGSVSKAQQYFEWIRNFAASTPFQIEGLTQSVILLESFGINGQKYLRTFGDAAAGLKVPLNELSRIMGQIYAKPTAQAEEMLQLIERGIPVQRILSKEMGLTAAQVGNIGREGIEGTKVFEALARGMEKLYGGAMEKMSQNWTGLISTLKDQVEMFLGKIAGPVLESLKDKLKSLMDNIDRWAADGTLQQWAEKVAAVIVALVDVLSKVVTFLYDVGKAIAYIVSLAGGLETIAVTLGLIFAVTKIQAFVTVLSATSVAFGVLNLNVSTFFLAMKVGLTGSNTLLSLQIGLVRAATAAWGLFKAALPFMVLAAGVKVFLEVNRLLKELASQYEKVMAAEIRHNDVMKMTTEKFRAFRDYAGLSSEQLVKITGDFKNIEDRGVRYNAIMRAIRDGRYGQEMAEQYKKWHTSLQPVVKSTDDLSGATKEAEKEIAKYRESLKLLNLVDLDRETQLLISSLKGNESQLYSNSEALEAVSKKVEELVTKYQILKKEPPQTLIELKEKTDLLLGKMDESIVSWDKVSGAIDMNVISQQHLQETLGGTTAETDLQNQSIEALKENKKDWLQLVQKLAGELQDFGGFISQATGLLSDMGIIGDDLAESLDNIGSGIGNIGSGIEAMTTKGASFIEKASGALTIISGAFKIAKGIWEGLKKLFSGDGVGEAIDREREMIEITEEMEKKIRELEETIGDTHAATSMLLDEIIATADVNLNNFDNYVQRTRDILADLDNGTLSIGEAGEAIGKAFTEILKHAERLGTEGSKKMIELISDVRSRGLEVAEIWEYSNEKLLSGVDALESYLSTFSDTQAIQKEIADIQNQLTGAVKNSKEALELNAQLIEKQNELAGAVQDIAGNWEFIQAGAMSLFHSLEQQGYSFVDITNIMQGSLQNIAKMALDNGLEVSEGLQAMLNMSNFIASHEDLAKRIEATRTMMEALGDSAFMTQNDFTGFINQTAMQFQDVLKATGDEELALRMISPALADIIKYSESYGFAIDENTQKLIDQARTEGVLQKDTMTGQEKIVGLLEAIAKKLGADIPYALEGLTGQVENSVSRISNNTTLWEDSLSSVEDRMTGIMGTMNDLDKTWENVVSGNTLIAQNELLVASLVSVDENIYSLSTAMQGVDQESATRILSIIGNINEWQARIEELKAKQEMFPGDYAIWEQALQEATTGMNLDIAQLQSLLASLGFTFSSDLPLDIDYLARYFAGMVSSMSGNASYLATQVGNLIFDFQTLQNLAGQNPLGDMSGYGIFTQEQVDAAVGKFTNMQSIMQTVLASNNQNYISNYLRDLQSLGGALEDTNLYGSYQKMLSMVQDYLSKIKSQGNIPPGNNNSEGKPGENSEKSPIEEGGGDWHGESSIEKYTPPRPVRYNTGSGTRTQYLDNTGDGGTGTGGVSGNVRIYNLYFPMGTSTGMKGEFREMFLEILGDNDEGFTGKVAVILKEYS